MKKRMNEKKQLYITIHVTADLRNKKLLVPKETAKKSLQLNLRFNRNVLQV